MEPSQIDRAKQLREEGKSFREISDELHVPLASVHRALKEDNGELERSNGMEQSPDDIDKDVLRLTIDKALAANDPEKIADLLKRLTDRQATLNRMLATEQSREQEAQKNMERRADLLAHADDPIGQQRAETALANARGALIQAQVTKQALARELAFLDRPVKELQAAKEEQGKAVIEATQAEALARAHSTLETVKTLFLAALDDISMRCKEAGRFGKEWNMTARAWKLPEAFPLTSSQPLDTLRKSVHALTIGEVKATAIPSVKVRLANNLHHPAGRPGSIALVSVDEARYLISTTQPDGRPLAEYVSENE